MLCVMSQSDVFYWGLQGLNYLNCLALYFSVKGETCMRQKDKQGTGQGPKMGDIRSMGDLEQV